VELAVQLVVRLAVQLAAQLAAQLALWLRSWLCGCAGWLCRLVLRQPLEDWSPLGGVILLSPRWRSAEDSFLFLLF